MRWLSEQLSYCTPDDWYRLTKEDFDAHHGGDLLSDYYQGFRAAALRDYLPTHDWHEWRFADVPGTFWQNPEHRRHYMQWLGEQLGYQALDDWYEISTQDIEAHSGRGLLNYYQHAVLIAVIDAFPEHKWQPEQFFQHQKRQQQLGLVVKQIFTEYDVESNVTHAGVCLDVFIPALKLAFECRGEQHRLPPSKVREIPALKKVRQQDDKKRKICQKHAITCVEIPCGWNEDGEITIEEFSKQFVKQMNACHTWTEHVRTALAAMSAYRQKQRRRRRKKPLVAQQQQLNLLGCV
jgi:hypothetical protein